MKYKFEPFKDRKELFLWASKGKPIWHDGLLYTQDIHGNYTTTTKMDYLSFCDYIKAYQKAIPVITKKIDTYINYYKESPNST